MFLELKKIYSKLYYSAVVLSAIFYQNLVAESKIDFNFEEPTEILDITNKISYLMNKNFLLDKKSTEKYKYLLLENNKSRGLSNLLKYSSCLGLVLG